MRKTVSCKLNLKERPGESRVASGEIFCLQYLRATYVSVNLGGMTDP